MDSVSSSGSVTAEGSIHAENIITGIQQQFTIIFQQPFTPPPDLVRLRTDYLTYLRDSYRYLDMKGIRQCSRPRINSPSPQSTFRSRPMPDTQ